MSNEMLGIDGSPGRPGTSGKRTLGKLRLGSNEGTDMLTSNDTDGSEGRPGRLGKPGRLIDGSDTDASKDGSETLMSKLMDGIEGSPGSEGRPGNDREGRPQLIKAHSTSTFNEATPATPVGPLRAALTTGTATLPMTTVDPST